MPKHHNKTANPSDRFWKYVQKSPGCWIWTGGITKYGARRGAFSYQGKTRLAHRVIYELTYGPVPDDMFVCHHCDNPLCVRPDHLFLGTPLDNASDMIRKGRARDRNGDPHRLISPEEINEIRTRYAKGGESYRSLAARYGVSRQSIYNIVNQRGKYARP